MYEDKTPEAIKAEILAAIRQSQGLSAMAGGFADGVAGPVAEQLSEAYRALEGVPSMLFVDELRGLHRPGGRAVLQHHPPGGDKGLLRHDLQRRAGAGDPQGHRVSDRRGLAYSLLAAVTLGRDGAGEGRLEAAEAGSAYNVEAGAIDRMYVNLTGLTDYQSEAAAGGTDAESDAALLSRIRERVQRPPPAATATSTGSGPWRWPGWAAPRWWSCPAGRGRWASRWWTATTGHPQRRLWRPWRPTSGRSGPSARR